MSVKERLDGILGVAQDEPPELLPAEVRGSGSELMAFEPQEDDGEEDRRLVKETLRSLIKKSSDVFDELIEVARESESARSYEVVGSLMKNIAEVADKLDELSKPKKEAEKPTIGNQVNNQNLFVGSSEELLNFMRENRLS